MLSGFNSQPVFMEGIIVSWSTNTGILAPQIVISSDEIEISHQLRLLLKGRSYAFVIFSCRWPPFPTCPCPWRLNQPTTWKNGHRIELQISFIHHFSSLDVFNLIGYLHFHVYTSFQTEHFQTLWHNELFFKARSVEVHEIPSLRGYYRLLFEALRVE